MNDEKIAELESLIKGFQELLDSDDAADYASSCEFGCTHFRDEFDKKRKALLKRAECYFTPEEYKWMYSEDGEDDYDTRDTRA